MTTSDVEIKEITGGNLDTSVAIIRSAFGKIADEMGYTEATAAPFPAFTTVEKMKNLEDRGAVFFGLYDGDRQVGFVVAHKEDNSKYYMKRLSVLPEFWHSGYGRRLVNHIIAYVKNEGEKKLYITMVDENPVLKKWYQDMGFKETAVRKFPQLPFNVSFMELDI